MATGSPAPRISMSLISVILRSVIFYNDFLTRFNIPA